MVDTTPLLPGLSPVGGKAVAARFDGGALSSDAGLLALRVNGGDKADHVAAQIQAICRAPSGMTRSLSR